MAPKFQTEIKGDFKGNLGDNNTFIDSAKDIDHVELAKQLALVRAAMKNKAPKDDPEADVDIGTIAQAEKAAKEGNSSKAIEILKTVGTWGAEVAKSVTAGLVKDAIEGKFGS